MAWTRARSSNSASTPWSRMALPRQIGRAHVWNSSHVRISYAVFCLKKKKKLAQVVHRIVAALELDLSLLLERHQRLGVDAQQLPDRGGGNRRRRRARQHADPMRDRT